MEELTENAEEPDEEESKQSVQKLGKLQYKVRTFFNSNLKWHQQIDTFFDQYFL